MIDREQILATEHQASLHAEADARRRARDATRLSTGHGLSAFRRTRRTFGQWLIAAGRHLEAGADPCAAVTNRAA